MESKTAAHFETVDSLSFVSQSRLKWVARKMCALRFGEVWDAPPAGLADVPVWRECGRACGRCRS